jgi:hypothetical protein
MRIRARAGRKSPPPPRESSRPSLGMCHRKMRTLTECDRRDAHSVQRPVSTVWIADELIVAAGSRFRRRMTGQFARNPPNKVAVDVGVQGNPRTSHRWILIDAPLQKETRTTVENSREPRTHRGSGVGDQTIRPRGCPDYPGCDHRAAATSNAFGPANTGQANPSRG